jgi:hypothetical protein
MLERDRHEHGPLRLDLQNRLLEVKWVPKIVVAAGLAHRRIIGTS